MRLQQQIGEAEDRRQHVVEVVRDAAGELAPPPPSSVARLSPLPPPPPAAGRERRAARGGPPRAGGRARGGGAGGRAPGAPRPPRPPPCARAAPPSCAGGAPWGAPPAPPAAAASAARQSTSMAFSVSPLVPSRIMRAKAALAVVMRPSAPTVAMPKGADWKKREKRTSPRRGLSGAFGLAVERRKQDRARIRPATAEPAQTMRAGRLRPSSRFRSRSS